jgi:hypothetical protein
MNEPATTPIELLPSSPVIKQFWFKKIASKGFSADLIYFTCLYFRKKLFAKIGPWKISEILIF